MAGAGFLNQRRENRRCRSAPQDQRRAGFFKIGGERLKAVMQPPARSAARRMVLALVMNVDRNDRAAAPARGVQRGVIAEAVIAPELDQRGGRGH